MKPEFEELGSWRRTTDAPLTVLAIGSLPILLLNFVSDRLSTSDMRFLYVVDVFIFALFAVDWVVEFYLVRKRGLYFRTEWPNLLIVLAQLIALLPALGVFAVLRAARGLRILVTLGRIFGVLLASSRQQGLQELREKLARIATGLAGFIWITSAVAFTLAEDVGDGRRVGSFFDALWWSASTITTVGYGDIYPTTAVGRLIAVLTMLTGISTLAVVTARIATFLIKDEKPQAQA